MRGFPWQERDRLLEQLWTDSTDWGRTRAFAETEPGHGYVRLNVRGREPQGIVEPGPEYEALCREIADELYALRHPRTGTPAVERVLFLHEEERGPHVDKLPDLCVQWSQAQQLDEVRHPRVGVIRERTRELQTAEHTGEAFFVGSGPSFRSGVEGSGANLTDIAPTLLHILGAPVPTDMDGEVLEELLAPSGPAAGPVRREPIDWDQDPWALDRATGAREPLTADRPGGPASAGIERKTTKTM
jgi:predicted AlkP superfamily phosphohydrolase/phosphomutase